MILFVGNSHKSRLSIAREKGAFLQTPSSRALQTAESKPSRPSELQLSDLFSDWSIAVCLNWGKARAELQ